MQLASSELDGVPLLSLGNGLALLQRFGELVISNLLQDIRIARLVDLKGGATFGAANGLHGGSFPGARKRWLMGNQYRENSGRLGTDGAATAGN